MLTARRLSAQCRAAVMFLCCAAKCRFTRARGTVALSSRSRRAYAPGIALLAKVRRRRCPEKC